MRWDVIASGVEKSENPGLGTPSTVSNRSESSITTPVRSIGSWDKSEIAPPMKKMGVSETMASEIEEGTGETLLGMLCRIRMSCFGRMSVLAFSKLSNSLEKITSAVWCLFEDTAFLIAATSG